MSRGRAGLSRERLRGCLEIGGIVVLAVALGGFAASTLLRHVETRPDAESEGTMDTTSSLPPEARARIRVDVRNGSGVPGAAGRMTGFLRDAGFDVVDFGNADRFDHERTVVVDRVGDDRRVREVAAALRGVPIRTEIDSTLYLDVTVVIGADLDAVLSRDDPEPGSGGWRRWLDRLPRR